MTQNASEKRAPFKPPRSFVNDISVPSAEEIKRVRADSGLTQRQFGQLALVHERSVSRWERGERRPDPRVWALLLHTLGYNRPIERGPDKGGFDGIEVAK